MNLAEVAIEEQNRCVTRTWRDQAAAESENIAHAVHCNRNEKSFHSSRPIILCCLDPLGSGEELMNVPTGAIWWNLRLAARDKIENGRRPNCPMRCDEIQIGIRKSGGQNSPGAQNFILIHRLVLSRVCE